MGWGESHTPPVKWRCLFCNESRTLGRSVADVQAGLDRIGAEHECYGKAVAEAGRKLAEAVADWAIERTTGAEQNMLAVLAEYRSGGSPLLLTPEMTDDEADEIARQFERQDATKVHIHIDSGPGIRFVPMPVNDPRLPPIRR